MTSRWSFQPGLFDGIDGERYEKYTYVDSMLKDRLVFGDSEHVGEYILNCRKGGFEGDFNVWDYPLLLESYKNEDKDLLGLSMPSGLEAKLMSDSNDE